MKSTSSFNGDELLEAGTTARLAYLEERLSEMALRLEAAHTRISALEQSSAAGRLPQVERHAEPSHAPRHAEAAESDLLQQGAPALGSSRMQDVLRMVYSGDAAGAQKLLLTLPKEEMERQPSIVAIVAATLCVQRGDMSGGLRALQRARQFADDPRLIRIIDLVEQQIELQAS